MPTTCPTPPTAEDLRQLVDDLATAEHHIAKAVLAAGRLAGSGVAERAEGLPLDLFIGLAARMTGCDRTMLIGAGEVLLQMPLTAALFSQGALSWGQIRRICQAARRMRLDQRIELDEMVAATAEDHRGLDAFGPDQLCDAVDAAADELRDPRSVERSEAAAERANYFQIQRTLLKRVQFYGDYDEVTAAVIVEMFDAAAGQPHGCGETDPPDGLADAGADAPAEDGDLPVDAKAERFTRRGKQYADALADVAAAYLAGGADRPRRPNLINVFVDLSQISVNNAGMIELNVRGPLPHVSLATLELLSKDADCRAVIFDGKRPLCVSRKLHAKDIPYDVAFAVAARDLGDRWPASNDPLGHTDIDHITMRSRGGLHSVDDLVRLSRRHHTLRHQRGWELSLEPTSGELTIRRGKRTWRSLPRGTPLSRPRPPVAPPASAGPGESALPF